MNLPTRSLTLSVCVAVCTLIIGCASQSTTIDSRLTPGRLLDDELLMKGIRTAIREEFRRNEYPYQIDTIVLDGHVYLLGTVSSQTHKDLATELASDFRHVKSVYNELHVGELRNAGRGTADGRIAAAARFVLANDPRTRGQDIQLHVHQGTAYLIGITRRSVGAAATDIVKYVRGVTSVTVLLDYLD